MHVCLVVMAGNCFWCILEEMFLEFEEYITVDYVVDRSLERAVKLWRYVELGYSYSYACKICVSQICVCVGWSYIDETHIDEAVGTVILPQIGELPVHLSLGEVLL